MQLHLKEITGDVFDISCRIKEIDYNYVVVYNLKNHRYEIHHRLQKDNTLALVIPFKELDARAITLTNKTKIENKEKLLREMQLHNKKLGIEE